MQLDRASMFRREHALVIELAATRIMMIGSNLLCRFLRDETAATAIEYGLIAGLIAIVIITSVRRLGTNLSTKFAIIANNLS